MIEKHCVSTAASGYFGHLVHPGYDEDLRLVKTGEISNPAAEHLRSFIRTLSSQEGQVWALLSALGAGEFWGSNCLPKGTPVLMSDGSRRPIEVILEGDEVLSHTGKARRVTKTYVHSGHGLVGIKPQGHGKDSVTTAGHPYFAVKKEEARNLMKSVIYRRDPSVTLQDARLKFVRTLSPIWIEAQDLEVGDYVYIKFPTEEVIHPELEGEDTAFILGVYAADGCLGRRKRERKKGIVWQTHSVIFTICGDDTAVRDRLVGALKKRGLSPYVVDRHQGHNVCRIQVGSPKLARICQEHIGRYSHGKEFSLDLLRMPREWQRVFLEAYLDRDGYVERGKGRGSVRLSTASINMAGGVRIIAARLGMATSIVPGTQHHTSLGAGNPIYEVRLPQGQLSGQLTRAESFIDPEGFIVSPVKSITYTDDWEGLVYNLEVEEDNSYLVDWVVLHNSNGDFFTHAGLVHTPKGWHDLSPALQRVAGPKWEWGYPTFYGAGVYRHHQNKDAARSFGKIHYVYWDPYMKRVLLVVLLDRHKAQVEGAIGIIDKIENGEFPPLSMGCRVPFDLCARCTDWSRITGNPQRDLAEHRRKPIRGLSVTIVDYCQHLQFERNTIYPDGVRACMLNLHPKFFDISFVFVGADKTSYMLAKLAGKCPIRPEKSQCSGGCRDCAFGSARSLSL